MLNSSVVEVRELDVNRGKPVLKGLNFDLPSGTITGLLGPSGCGKTTLMRAIVGTQRITRGGITVLGRPAGGSSLRKRVAYTSQQLSVYTDLTVRENVQYFAGLVGGEVDRAITQVHLTEYADQRVENLSGGQANRVSLACALVGSPELLILDEPTVGLDPLTREQLWKTFRSIAAGGATLLISSHVMDEAARCDTVLFMREGAILAHEPIAELQQRTHTATAEDAFLALVKEAA